MIFAGPTRLSYNIHNRTLQPLHFALELGANLFRFVITLLPGVLTPF
jgi:hypothetical protein